MKEIWGLQLVMFCIINDKQRSAIYRMLAIDSIVVVDIHTASICCDYGCTFLLDVPHPQATAWQHASRNLLRYCKEHRIACDIQSISDADYQQWLSNRDTPHYVVTILVDGLSIAIFEQIEAVLQKHALHINNIKRLSGDPRLKRYDAQNTNVSALEFSLHGLPQNEELLRIELLTMGQDLGINLGFQRDNIYRRHRRLLAVDMDSTLITIETIDHLAAIKGDETMRAVSALTAKAMDGAMDFEESLRRRVRLLKGLTKDILHRVAEDLPLTAGAHALFARLNLLGYRTAIISGGFDLFAKSLQNRLEIDNIYANHLEFDGDVLSGELKGEIIDSKAKAEKLSDMAKDLGIAMEQTIAVGDGANDIEMISKAGMGIAFCSRPVLLRNASHALSVMGLDGILHLLDLGPETFATTKLH